MNVVRHIWWVMTHNTIIIGAWWFLIVILCGVLITRALSVAQKVFTTFYNTVSDTPQWNITLIQAVVWIAKVSTWIIIIALVASRMGIPPSLMAAMGTIIGAALGFGSQETVRDVVKGAIHLLERQFSVGDYVGFSVGGSDYSGVIKDVSLRTVTLASEEQGAVSIPQGNITLIQNYSRSIGEFVVNLPFDTSVSVSPIIKHITDVVDDIGNRDSEILPKYLTEEDMEDIHTIIDSTVRGVSNVDNGRIIIQIKGESTPGKQFAAKRALLKAIAGHLEDCGTHFYAFSVPGVDAR